MLVAFGCTQPLFQAHGNGILGLQEKALCGLVVGSNDGIELI